MINRLFSTPFRFLHRKKLQHFDYHTVESVIAYSFKDKSLLYRAFKHRSFLSVTKETSSESNERLEFLGDAVLDLIVTDYLYRKLPKQQEGQLSKLKSVLVSRKVLAELVSDLNIGKFLLVDPGEEKTGGKKRPSNLANLYESLVGAIYLDSSLKKSRTFVEKTLLVFYDTILRDTNYLNYKSILLEHAQSIAIGNPGYCLIKSYGPDHDKMFVIEVTLPGTKVAIGEGKTKKVAEQEAARNLLLEIAPHLLVTHV